MTIEELSTISQSTRLQRIAEAQVGKRNLRDGITIYRQPPGTEGYRCDLSGCVILQRSDGVMLGPNYDSTEKLMLGEVEEMARHHGQYKTLEAIFQAEADLICGEGERWLDCLGQACGIFDDFAARSFSLAPDQWVKLLRADAAQRRDALVLFLGDNYRAAIPPFAGDQQEFVLAAG